MPQPLSVAQADKVTPGTLTKEQYAGIGEAAVAWAKCEYALALCFSKLSGADMIACLLAMQNMTARNKIDTLGALANDRVIEKFRPELIKLMTTAKRLSSLRHTFVHAQWIGADKNGSAVSLQLTARLDRTAVVYQAWKTSEINRVAVECSDLFNALNAFLIRHKLWDGADPF